jgi:hypothetical protein
MMHFVDVSTVNNKINAIIEGQSSENPNEILKGFEEKDQLSILVTALEFKARRNNNIKNNCVK